LCISEVFGPLWVCTCVLGAVRAHVRSPCFCCVRFVARVSAFAVPWVSMRPRCPLLLCLCFRACVRTVAHSAHNPSQGPFIDTVRTPSAEASVGNSNRNQNCDDIKHQSSQNTILGIRYGTGFTGHRLRRRPHVRMYLKARKCLEDIF